MEYNSLNILQNLDKIRKPVEEQLKQFEPYFSSAMKSKVPLLSIITNYIYRRKGKQLRPLIVFLSAGLVGRINSSTFVAAAMVELLHTATLIHDDVVDEAYERRGSHSINALWRSKIAVLVGDFLLSKGLLLSLETNEFELLKHMSEAVKEMSEGELLQIERSRKMDINEEIYLEIIRKKTATLLAACTVNGACSAKVTIENLEKMRAFGIALGMAFQIKDDIFDFLPQGLIGKPSGNDVKEKKLTLPLIYSLTKVEKAEQNRILKLVRKSKHDPKALQSVLNFTHQQGGIEYGIKTMNEYRDKAKQHISEFPESPYKDSLLMLCDYITERKK
ncbi:MAG TPA: polyprenyl synthetase family protein [Tenuifilaceae bacterium]|nr:polyprenyl synthetase family protein [Tenuifilaceae bacterium]HPE17019.1 polyprenyl synthetase family protein [Tenuifilaceae bacterium]